MEPRELPRYADVVVVGAGIAGISSAVRLARAGLDVVVLEAHRPASGTTGYSSAKVSIVHGLHAHRIAGRDGSTMARRYVQANRFGLDWIAAEAETMPGNCRWERRAGVTYVTDPRRVGDIEAEVAVMADAGEAARLIDPGLPFATSAAVSIDDQAQFDPVRFVDGIVNRFLDDGGTLVGNGRVTGVSPRSDGVTVHSDRGDVECGRVVVATGLPIVDRGAHFARTRPVTSYVTACVVEQLPPAGMYLSADGPTRSLRTATRGDRSLLLVGGEDHVTGQGGDTRRNHERLHDWTDRHFGIAETVARFSTHDYTTPDLRPFVGPVLPGHERILVATGFNKWGFTNAAAGAELLRAMVTGDREPPWAEVFTTSRVPMSGVGSLLAAGSDVAARTVGGWVDALRSHDSPSPGEGRVTRRGRRPVAVSVDETGASSCAVSGVCTHLGGIVAWNPAAGTWDCPLHGSRFERDGSMRHGPAVSDLPPRG